MGCESFTIKKAECQRIDAFELWCWWRLLRVPWTARRSNQSILKEISPEYWLEGLILKLKLQVLGHLTREQTHWKGPWCWERLKAGGEGDDRGWDGWMASPTRRTWIWASSGSWWWTGRPGVLQSMGSQRVRHDWETELNWDHSPLGSSVHGVSQTNMLEWAASCYSRRSSWLIAQISLATLAPPVSAGGLFTTAPHRKPLEGYASTFNRGEKILLRFSDT